jgi:hypothetical protein
MILTMSDGFNRPMWSTAKSRQGSMPSLPGTWSRALPISWRNDDRAEHRGGQGTHGRRRDGRAAALV